MTAPQPLGKYQIESLLGKGAFAEVYKALDTSLKRTVALKVLKPALLADEEAFARFVQEAQVLASLVHPHIAWVWDLGEAQGRYFIAMRYVDGQSLDKVIAARGALPWEEALKITEQIAEALQFAHQKELVHRDVKPQNILVSESEGAVLTDFGLVKALRSSGMSSTASMIGTPAYIAPEIWNGEAASPASDQYALACVLAEMLAGKVLFDGTTPAIMKKHLLEPPPLPEKAPKGAPASLLDCLRKALNKKPEERYQSLTLFVVALKEPLPGRAKAVPVEVKPPAYSPPKTSPEEDKLVIALAPGVEMTFLRVPAGEFQMGSNDGDEDERPQHTLFLEEYWIGKTPVTNVQYQAFVRAAGYHPPEHWKKGYIPDGKGDHPVIYVDWQDAVAFCEWLSQVSGEKICLPSEAEWEKAARGTDGRKFPWGNQKPNKNLCNYNHWFSETSSVGKYSPQGDSPFGCVDMAGNVWEWTNSLYKKYPYRNDDGREDLNATGVRVLRGGSWFFSGGNVRSADRYGFDPTLAVSSFGFRCSRSP